MTLILALMMGMELVVLLFLLFLQKHEIRSIARQLKEIKGQDTNGLVHSGGGSKASAELIDEINVLLKEMNNSRMFYNQKNHALEQMMTNISHDLRTPLTSAMGYIQIIQNSELSEEEKNRELAIIEKRLIRLEELINSFFEFSQIISSGKVLEKAEVNLTAVLEESIAHYYDDFCDKDRKIAFDCKKHKLMICSNKNMLLRIFDNLIGNALKHGAGDLTISVDSKDAVCISFENELTEPDLDINHIFDEFYTTDISRTKGNTGLGLAIVKQFADILDGTITAQNKDNMFLLTISFPIVDSN